MSAQVLDCKVVAQAISEECKAAADELKAKGEEADFEAILQNLRERDRIDSTRAVAPLRQAEDALVLDNSHLTIEQQKQWLLDQFYKLTS